MKNDLKPGATGSAAGARPLIILGAGGYGAEACWLAQEMNAGPGGPRWEVLGFADDNRRRQGENYCDRPVFGPVAAVLERFGAAASYHVAVGSNVARAALAAQVQQRGLAVVTLIHPSAVVASTAVIGAGAYVGPLAVLAPYCQVGGCVLVNAHADVGHHAQVHDFAQLCPGSRVSGFCVVGQRALLGANAVIQPGKKVGDDATVGANSFVLRDVAPGTVAVGVPAHVIRKMAPADLASQNQALRV
jgi:sugar O-acyltransferase (sialic acid O-acetyltransferase NeuD family)